MSRPEEVTDGPEKQPVSDQWLVKMKGVELGRWLAERFEEGTSEGWVAINFDSKIYEWATKQLRQTAQQDSQDSEEQGRGSLGGS